MLRKKKLSFMHYVGVPNVSQRHALWAWLKYQGLVWRDKAKRLTWSGC